MLQLPAQDRDLGRRAGEILLVVLYDVVHPQVYSLLDGGACRITSLWVSVQVKMFGRLEVEYLRRLHRFILICLTYLKKKNSFLIL